MRKILIAVPCMDTVSARFAQSLATLRKVDRCVVSFLMGSLIYDSRNQLAGYALEMEADYILWLDSDMIFAPDTLERMIKTLDEHPEIDILSGLYFRRAYPFTPVLFKKLDEGENGSIVFEDYNDYPDELFELEGVGFGCVLMRTDCLFQMLDEDGVGRWFTPLGGAGEDCAFCIRARRAGYRIFVDPSVELGHMAYAPVTQAFYKANKKEGLKNGVD